MSRAARANHGLAERQLAFALLMLQGGIAAGRAYEQAGYKATGSSADVNASKLLKTPKVVAFLEQERAVIKQRAGLTLERCLLDLHATAMDEKVDGASRVAAHKLLIAQVAKFTPAPAVPLTLQEDGGERDFARRSLAIFDAVLAGRITAEYGAILMDLAHKGVTTAHGATLGDDMRAERPQPPPKLVGETQAPEATPVRPKWLKGPGGNGNGSEGQE